MSTKHYNRPSSNYSGEVGLINRTLFQDISATRPRVAISSAAVDSQINYVIDAVNELYDLTVTGILPNKSVTLAKIADQAVGSILSWNASSAAVLVSPSGTPGYVLTENAGAAPSFQPTVGVPAGALMPYAGVTAPSGWLIAAGQLVSRTTYAALFTAIGTTYGAGDGSTTFALPDISGRTVIGKDNGVGTQTNRVQVVRNLTTTAGSATATIDNAAGLSVGMFLYSASLPAGITIANIVGTTITLSTGTGVLVGSAVATRISVINDPNMLGSTGGSQFLQKHAHGITDPGHVHSVNRKSNAPIGAFAGGGTNAGNSVVGDTDSAVTGITINTAGEGSGQNIQPSIVLNYIIKT